MRLTIAAVGRLAKGPERALCDKLLGRLDALARTTRIGPADLRELEPKSADRGARGEARLLEEAVLSCEKRVALDERGAAQGSLAFARRLEEWRDEGVRNTGFLIGGADGLDPALRGRADVVISFGAMTWPHAMARAMLLEQLYRAATIAAGHPYHREG